jgi:hypothetical protein
VEVEKLRRHALDGVCCKSKSERYGILTVEQTFGQYVSPEIWEERMAVVTGVELPEIIVRPDKG